MDKILILLVFSFSLFACTQKNSMSHVYGLRADEIYLDYPIDDETVVPLFNLYTFRENDKEYLAFSNDVTRSLLIYDVLSGELVKKIVFDSEGANGIGRDLCAFFIKDFNHIYIPDVYRNFIYETDTTGVVKRRLDFSEAVAGFRTSPAYITNHDERALFLKDNLLCIPQDYKSDVDEKQSSTYIAIDLENGKVTPYSIPFPDWVLEKSQGKTVEIPSSYSCTYNGDELIYSFAMDNQLYKVNLQSMQVERKMAKSIFIFELDYTKMPDDFNRILKKTCESAGYGRILYDKYRKVYYRIAYAETELESGLDYRKILHTGKAEFSIIILDEDLNVLGETKFPAFTYVPHICFIREDGLYISTSHFMREDYSDDWLRFQRIELVKNK